MTMLCPRLSKEDAAIETANVKAVQSFVHETMARQVRADKYQRTEDVRVSSEGEYA